MRKKKHRPLNTDNAKPTRNAIWDIAGAHLRWIATGGLLLAVWIAYISAINAPFVFDDSISVLKNESIRSLWPLVGTTSNPGPLNPAEHTPTAGRPLVNLSLAVNYYLGGFVPNGYHAFNVVVHSLSALLLWAIVGRTLRMPDLEYRFGASSDWLAFAVALLWALHPLQTEAVIYVTQRTELLMAFFYLATLYCSLRYWQSNLHSVQSHYTWLFLATCACWCGMVSKEVMVSAPVVVLLYDRAFVSGSLQSAIRKSWPLYIGLASGWILLYLLNASTPRDDSAGFHLEVPATHWWLTQAKVLLMYLKLVLWPWPLLIHYEIPYLESFTAAWKYVLPVAILALGTLVLLWRNASVGFLGLAFFAILSPTLVVPITTEVAAERRMYLPLAALVALLVIGGYYLVQEYIRRKSAGDTSEAPTRRFQFVCLAAVLFLALLLGAVSVKRLAAYQSEMRLWQEVVRHQPRNHLAQLNLGYQLYKSGQVREAIEHYEVAIRLNPESPQARYNFGHLLLATGDTDKAIAQYREAVRLMPNSGIVLNNLGVALVKANRHEESLEVFREAVELDPQLSLAHDNLAIGLQRSGKLPEAIEHFRTAIKLNPKALDVYGRLADACARDNRPLEAIAAAEEALAQARAMQDYETASKIAAQLRRFRVLQNQAPSE